MVDIEALVVEELTTFQQLDQLINNTISMLWPFLALGNIIVTCRIASFVGNRMINEGGYFPNSTSCHDEQEQEEKEELETIFDDCKVIETEHSIGIFKKDSWTCPYCDRENREEDYACEYCAAPKMRSMYQTKSNSSIIS